MGPSQAIVTKDCRKTKMITMQNSCGAGISKRDVQERPGDTSLVLLKQAMAQREVRVRRARVLVARRVADEQVGEPAEAEHEVRGGLGQAAAGRALRLPIVTANRVKHFFLVDVARVPTRRVKGEKG